MDTRRRHNRPTKRSSSYTNKPPSNRAKCQQQTVPLWEKQFCKVVGLFDWDTILDLQRGNSFYANVVNWDASAAEEAFYNAKKRFWAEINGLSCDVQLPDPNMYIDEINWDSKTDLELYDYLESTPVTCNREEYHDPVIIFGDILVSNQGYSPRGWGDVKEKVEQFQSNSIIVPTGWGDEKDNFEQVQGNSFSPTGWGDEKDNFEQVQGNSFSPTGWGDEKDNFEQFQGNSFSNNHTNQWEQGWGVPVNNTSNYGQPDYYYSNNNAWDFSGNNGYATWENGWNGDWGQNYANNFNYELESYREEDKRDARGWNYGWGESENYGYNDFSYEVGLGSEDKRAGGGNEHWNNQNNAIGNNSSSYHTSRYTQMPVMGTINR